MSRDNVLVARIGKPHGLNGEVTVQLHTDDPHRRLADGAVLDTEASAGSGVPRRLTIRSTRVHNGIWLLAFEEVPDRTGAEGLRGTRLLAEADAGTGDGVDGDTDAADEEAWYEEDLVGLEARDPAGAVVGTVSGLELGAAQDRLVVTLTDGVIAYVPFVRQFVPTVESDHVVLDPPAGLFDLYRDEAR